MINFLNSKLSEQDTVISGIIANEFERQKNSLQLIASENFTSLAVMQAQGSVLTNKYAEGYPGRRYYCGCKYIDEIEQLAIERACALFKTKYANVQPHSGSQANQAVFTALLKPGNTILGMSLSSGGHLTHGAAPSISGKFFQAVQYGVNPDTHLIEMDQISELAHKYKPVLIIAGGSAYSRAIDFKGFRKIADEVGAYFLADIAHYAGLVAAEIYPSPVEHAHIVTMTTHKTLRGPRGGLILTNDEQLAKKINSAVFPGIQGGPFMNSIAAKAVAFNEASTNDFKTYAKNVLGNAKILAESLKSSGMEIVSGGTDCHMVLVDLRPKSVTGNIAVESLERSGITSNKNTVPFDKESPIVTSGLRIGSAAETSRGLSGEQFKQVGDMISYIIDGLSSSSNISHRESEVRDQVINLCKLFDLYNFSA